jgi:hypothetical protein
MSESEILATSGAESELAPSPRPELTPEVSRDEELEQTATHSQDIDEITAAINSLMAGSSHSLQLRPTHLLNLESQLEDTLQNTFEQATLQQQHPGQRLDDLEQQQRQDVQATATLNVKAVSMLAAAGQLTAKAMGSLLENTSLVVDKAMTALHNNALAQTAVQQNSTMNDDPNSPASLLSAMQNGDGSLLVNILRDSAAAAVVEQNLEVDEENTLENNQANTNVLTGDQATFDLEQEEELDAENQQAAEQSHTHAAAPKPSHGKSEDELEVLENAKQATASQDDSALKGAEALDLLKGATDAAESCTASIEKMAEAMKTLTRAMQ